MLGTAHIMYGRVGQWDSGSQASRITVDCGSRTAIGWGQDTWLWCRLPLVGPCKPNALHVVVCMNTCTVAAGQLAHMSVSYGVKQTHRAQIVIDKTEKQRLHGVKWFVETHCYRQKQRLHGIKWFVERGKNTLLQTKATSTWDQVVCWKGQKHIVTEDQVVCWKGQKHIVTEDQVVCWKGQKHIVTEDQVVCWKGQKHIVTEDQVVCWKGQKHIVTEDQVVCWKGQKHIVTDKSNVYMGSSGLLKGAKTHCYRQKQRLHGIKWFVERGKNTLLQTKVTSTWDQVVCWKGAKTHCYRQK